MRAQTFWKTVTVDQTNLLESLVSLLTKHQIRYCVIGGQAVNAYVEPVVSLDLDLVISADQIEMVESLCRARFNVERFPRSLNVSQPGSDLRVQIQTDSRYFSFPQHATLRNILGFTLPVARLEDVLQGKVWSVVDLTQRGSKRLKDLTDIARVLEAYPQLRDRVPAEILERLL